MAVERMCFRPVDSPCRAVPRSARLFASVAPLVKMISSGLAADQVCHLASRSLNGFLGALTKDVRAAPGVAKLLQEVRSHRLEHAGSRGVVAL